MVVKRLSNGCQTEFSKKTRMRNGIKKWHLPLKKGANALFSSGEPGAIRTRGLQSRSLTLYPAELRVHNTFIINDSHAVVNQFFDFHISRNIVGTIFRFLIRDRYAAAVKAPIHHVIPAPASSEPEAYREAFVLL